jgi:ketosteroid isomerase-like protein
MSRTYTATVQFERPDRWSSLAARVRSAAAGVNSRDTARAMSQANVEAFKRAFDAINRRDAEALLSELDPEVEWHGAILMAMGGDRTVYRGHEGVREWLRDLYETLSEFHADYQEILDLGDRTVGIGVVRGRGTPVQCQ